MVAGSNPAGVAMIIPASRQSRRSSAADRSGLGDDPWLPFNGSARQIEGDCQPICQRRIGPEAELLGGTARISNRNSDFARSCRAVAWDGIGLVQFSHGFGEGPHAGASASADVEDRGAGIRCGQGSVERADGIPDIYEVANLLSVAKNFDWFAEPEPIGKKRDDAGIWRLGVLPGTI